MPADDRATTAAGRWYAALMFALVGALADGLVAAGGRLTALGERLDEPALRYGVRAHGRAAVDAQMAAHVETQPR